MPYCEKNRFFFVRFRRNTHTHTTHTHCMGRMHSLTLREATELTDRQKSPITIPWHLCGRAACLQPIVWYEWAVRQSTTGKGVKYTGSNAVSLSTNIYLCSYLNTAQFFHAVPVLTWIVTPYTIFQGGHAVVQFVYAMRHKAECRGFDPRLWELSLT